MAKQSFKNTIYQQITNSQVQKAVKEQRDQDFKMAQDLIAQYQPTNDDMAMAQNLIAQYQQPAPQPTPIKQTTVNEVKAESAPTQQIPSIEDFFKVKTASGKDVNKESAKFIQRREKERELASKNSKEEIAKKIVENKEVKPFVPETNIEDQNSVNDYRKNLLGKTAVRKDQPEVLGTERNELDELAKVFKASMKDYNPKFTAAGKRWENPYDSLTDEQKQLVRDYIIQNQNNTNLSKEERETLKAFNRAYNSSDEEKDSRYNGRAAYLNSKNDFERGLQSLAAGFTDMNMPLAEAMAKGFSKLPILNQIDYEKSRDDTREYINESKALNPQAAEAGRSLGQVYDYAITSPFVGGIGEAAKLGKVGTAALNQAVQFGQDVALDLVPEARRMQQEEGGVNVGELLKRGATDVAQNAFMEAVPWLGAANYDSLVKSVGNNADIFKNIDATGALKNAPDAIRSIADAIDDSEKVPFTKTPNAQDVAVKETTQQAEDIADAITEANKNSVNNPVIDSNKVMAEEISKPKSEIVTSKPIEPEKYEAPIDPEVKPNGPDGSPNMKVSEAYTNTGKRGGGWNEAEYSKYTNPDDYLYESIDELRSVEEATNMRATEGREAFKNRVLGADRVSSVELDGLMMEWRELTEEARALEEAGKDATDLWAESNKVFRKVQEQSTNNAQALQALAKWSRNTPEGMLINAENIVNGKNKVAQSDLQKFIEKHFKQKKGNIEFSPEFEKEFLKTAEPLRELRGEQLDTREAKEIMAQLGKMVNEQLPVKLNEKLQSFLMDNMLGNFRTLITRNAGGNVGLNAVEQTLQRPLAAGIDSLLSLKTGKRTQAGLSRAGIAEYLQGFGKGLKDEATDLATGLHTARSGENTLENAIRANRHVFKTKVADGLDGLVKHGLSVGDRPFYEAVYNQTLGDYNRLRARGLMGDQVQALSDADFKLYSETAAKMNALAAVYQQDSMLSNALMGFKKDIGMLSNGIVGVDILSQFSMPFVKTPANVIERAIDYSPLGAIRNTFRTGKELKAGTFDQNRFANESARNILGTALMGGSAAYAANGGLTGSFSENKNEKQAQKESGMQEYAWNVPDYVPGIGGKQMDISWIPVVGSNAVASAAAVDQFNKGEGSLGENLTQGVQAGGKALFDQSMFQGLQRLFGTGESYNSDEGIVGNMKNVVTAGVGQAIPSLARQIAQVTDDYQRDTAYSNKGTSFGPFDTYDINSLANNIPGFREQYLAPKVDTSGNLLKENQGRNIGMKVLEDMILPGKLTDFNMSKLAEEATRLSGATENAFIQKADRKAIDTDEHTLTNDEWVNYQQNYYQQMTKAGEQLIEQDFYKSASEEDQAKLLHDTYGAIKSAINSDYTGKEVTGAAKAYKEAGGGDKGIEAVLNYETAHNIMKDSGVTSTSKAGEAIQEAINKGDMEEANKLAKVEENYNKACEIAGVEEKSSGTRKAWEDGGTTGLKEYVAKQKLFEQYDLENDSTSRAVYDNWGEDGLKDLQNFKDQGIKGSTVVGIYQSAKSDGNVPNIKDFATTYKKMDGYGDSNGTVSQKEFVAYLEKNGISSQEDAQRLATIYGDWSTIPVLGKKGWQFKKTK